MPKVPVEKLEAGMMLAKPLTRGSMVVLGEGTVLTERWIERIADMAIDHVFIDGPSEQAIPKQEAMAQIDRRFRNTEDKPYMKEIKKILKEHVDGLYG
jgi:hypothetical protein